LSGQPTAAVSSDETGTNHPTPIPAVAPSDSTPKPFVVTLAEMSGRNPRPIEIEPEPIDLSAVPASPIRDFIAAIGTWFSRLLGPPGR
jgi:hypothetical protein